MWTERVWAWGYRFCRSASEWAAAACCVGVKNFTVLSASKTAPCYVSVKNYAVLRQRQKLHRVVSASNTAPFCVSVKHCTVLYQRQKLHRFVGVKTCTVLCQRQMQATHAHKYCSLKICFNTTFLLWDWSSKGSTTSGLQTEVLDYSCITSCRHYTIYPHNGYYCGGCGEAWTPSAQLRVIGIVINWKATHFDQRFSSSSHQTQK